MYAADYRSQARNALRGKWNVCALMYFVYSLIVGVCASVASYIGGGARFSHFGLILMGLAAAASVAMLLIEGPFLLGFSTVALTTVRGGAVRFEMLFDGFKEFGRALGLYLLNGIFTFLWSLLFVVPGIVASYAYSMSYFILRDVPNMTANEARKKSVEIMKGHKWQLFCLDLSFIGWFVLSALTFGILSFWVSPYVQTAHAAFYQNLLPQPAIDETLDGEVQDDYCS